MATQISRDILNKETNALFWAQTGYKPGQQLDPNNPLDKAKMPVWMDIFRKVKAQADAGTLVTTYDRPEVAQPLADAAVASKVAAVHVDAGAKAPDPATAQQHTSAALVAQQVATQKLIEAASKQPPTVSPKLVDDAAREAAKTPPPPNAPAVDQIAHAQMQNGKNGQSGKTLRPEDDPWDSRYVPKSERAQSPAQPSKSPREQPPARPSKPPPAILYKETNARFWNRTRYKPGQKLDMSIPEDRKMSKTWMEILHEVEREANEGTLTFTSPDLGPAPDARTPPSRPPTPRPMPPPQQPMPPPGMEQMPPPPQRPMPPPGMQWPMPGMQWPMPPPGMQRPMPPGMHPGMQLPWPPPGMQRPMPPGMQQPGMQRPMPPGMQQPMQPMQPMQPTGTRPPTPGAPSIPTESAPPVPSPTEGVPKPTEGAPAPTEIPPAEGMSTKAKIALGVGGLGVLAAIVYAVTRKPSGGTASFPRSRARAAARVSPGRASPAIGASSSAFPSSRGGGY